MCNKQGRKCMPTRQTSKYVEAAQLTYAVTRSRCLQTPSWRFRGTFWMFENELGEVDKSKGYGLV